MTVLSGIINIDKPSGVTSYWVVTQVKRLLGIKKVGHCGTLDPLASGVLIIVFGKATKLQAELMSGKKTYRARLRLGTVTDTGDITGKVIKESEAGHVETAGIRDVLKTFLGETEQVPPMYSALKYGGRRLYDIAREGGEVKREPRKITVYSLEMTERIGNSVEILTECSKGTYIRTLGEDIGTKLGCGATIEALRRERSGDFSVDEALDGKKLQVMSREELLNHCKMQI